MSSDVTKYEVMISDAIRAELDVKRKEKALEKSRKTFEKRMSVLRQDCQKCFDNAVEKYNETGSYKIFDARVGILLSKETVSAGFRLAYTNGHGEHREPDEFFDEKDHERILSILKPLVDEELKKQGITLTFHSFSAPADYYSE